MKALLAAAALGSTMIGGLAGAQTTPPAPRPGAGMMSRIDTNGDGVITREEYLAGVDQRFDRLDINHDGVLSANERPMRGHGMGADAPAPPPSSAGATGQPPAPPTEAARRPMTRDEFRAGALRRFDRMDLNHDGKLDQSEFNALPPRMPRARDGVPRNLPTPPAE